jgi:hypothetical protein
MGFFAMHGEPTKLHLGDGEDVGLGEVASWMSGTCQGKRLYFGSCSVLQAPDDTLRGFLRETRATLLCGYTREIDWVDSAAFETVVLDSLVNA